MSRFLLMFVVIFSFSGLLAENVEVQNFTNIEAQNLTKEEADFLANLDPMHKALFTAMDAEQRAAVLELAKEQDANQAVDNISFPAE